MDEHKEIRVIELRNYLLKPNVRRKFADYFGNHFVESQNALGGHVLGQYAVDNKNDNFFWVRGFENMKSRSRFLPEFYNGAVWKQFGAAANEMMIDSDNVYLLKPIDELQVFRTNKVVKIDYYFARRNQLEPLLDFLQTKYLSSVENLKFGDATLWRSELSENDFPRLPVFQYENLLTVITTFENIADEQSKSKKIGSYNAQLEAQLERFITEKNSLILYEI